MKALMKKKLLKHTYSKKKIIEENGKCEHNKAYKHNNKRKWMLDYVLNIIFYLFSVLFFLW